MTDLLAFLLRMILSLSHSVSFCSGVVLDFIDYSYLSSSLLTLIFYRSVADQLKVGQTVKPEAYESVSVYFSDIVGFTSISAICTPFQVLYSD